MSTAAFQEEAARLLELLAAVSARLAAAAARGALPPAAGQHAAALRAVLLNLSSTGGQRLLAEDGQRWLADAERAHQHLVVVAEAVKGTSEGPILARAVRDSDALLTQASEALEPEEGPPLTLLAGGTAAAFAIAWLLFRGQAQVHTEMELSDESEGEGEGEPPEVEYLAPEPELEPRPGRAQGEIEDAEFEPA